MSQTNDLISRSALQKHILGLTGMFTDELGFALSIVAVNSSIEAAPSVDAEVVRHGRWYDKGVPGYPHMHDWRCSVCEQTRSVNRIAPKDNYYPNCGAKMDAEVEG